MSLTLPEALSGCHPWLLAEFPRWIIQELWKPSLLAPSGYECSVLPLYPETNAFVMNFPMYLSTILNIGHRIYEWRTIGFCRTPCPPCHYTASMSLSFLSRLRLCLGEATELRPWQPSVDSMFRRSVLTGSSSHPRLWQTLMTDCPNNWFKCAL